MVQTREKGVPQCRGGSAWVGGGPRGPRDGSEAREIRSHPDPSRGPLRMPVRGPGFRAASVAPEGGRRSQGSPRTGQCVERGFPQAKGTSGGHRLITLDKRGCDDSGSFSARFSPRAREQLAAQTCPHSSCGAGSLLDGSAGT